MAFIRRRILTGSWTLLPAWLGAMVGLVLALAVGAAVAVMGLIGLSAALIRRMIGGRMPRPVVAAPPKPVLEPIAMQRAEDGTWRQRGD